MPRHTARAAESPVTRRAGILGHPHCTNRQKVNRVATPARVLVKKTKLKTLGKALKKNN